MTVRIDKAGRVAIPKRMRERLGLDAETELELVEQPEGILLRRVEQQPAMIRVDGLWVHQGTPEPGIDWDRVMEDAREERIQTLLKA